MDPREVINPKNMIDPESIDIVVGKTEEAYFSIAILKWDGELRVGIRWNNSGAKKKGYPIGAFGRPQWFILPKEIAIEYAKVYAEKNHDVTIIEKIKATSDAPLT